MLYLLFNLGADHYALSADRIVQVLPASLPRRLRGAPPVISGAITYRRQNLPVIDLVKLETGYPAATRIGTRIIVTAISIAERPINVGLVLENATQTFRCKPEYFTPFAPSPRGLVQLLDLDSLLPAHLFGDFSLQLGAVS